jgi:hypothetical protein|tara:strand:- start:1909 stop:3843 length:1935 start_codon:yes stop_codon:yes gene_type:complete
MADRNRNPRNDASPLFKRLTKLFSGPLVNYDAQMVVRNSKTDADKLSSRFKSASGQQFKKTSYNPFSNLSSATMSNQARSQRYIDFDQMEYEPIIASALDIYADEMTTSSHLHPLLKINCPNEEIKIILNSLFHNILNIEHNLFGWCRTMCKFGDFMLYLDIEENKGVVNAIGLPTREVERLEGEDKTNPNYIQYQWNTAGMTFENWQLAHFRILGNDKHAPYGTSILDPARRIFRQLSLLEDAMMSYRIVRSPERRVFYVDVGSINPNDIEQYMQKVVTQMKRNQVVDSNSGRVDLRYNPMSVDEDYFIPVRGGQSTRIETLPGGTYTGDIDDVKYLKDKLFSALKIPQSYLFQGEGSSEDQTTLAQKDIRFARTIQRLQRVIITELEKIAIIHLYTLGYRGNDLISFKMSLNNPSKIAELQELEQWRVKFDVASAASEGFFSKRWLSTNLFNISEEEFLRNQREIVYDRLYQSELDMVSETEATEGGGGSLSGLLDGDDAGDNLDTDDVEDAPRDEEGGEATDEPDTNLLAVPGNRDDKVVKMAKKGSNGKVYTTTSKSKGKLYEPTDDLTGKRAMKRSMKSQAGMRGITGVPKGYKKMDRLSRGIYTEQRSNYDEQEKTILEVNNEIKNLITEMENKKDVK